MQYVLIGRPTGMALAAAGNFRFHPIGGDLAVTETSYSRTNVAREGGGKDG